MCTRGLCELSSVLFCKCQGFSQAIKWNISKFHKNLFHRNRWCACLDDYHNRMRNNHEEWTVYTHPCNHPSILSDIIMSVFIFLFCSLSLTLARSPYGHVYSSTIKSRHSKRERECNVTLMRLYDAKERKSARGANRQEDCLFVAQRETDPVMYTSINSVETRGEEVEVKKTNNSM